MNYLSKIKVNHFISGIPAGAFLISGVFAVLLWSPNVLGVDKVTILVLLIPWIILGPLTHFNLVASKEFRTEIVLLVAIILLGLVNVTCSDNPARTYASMRMFLLTGAVALWTSMFLLTGEQQRQIFDWFSCACIAVISITEILVYLFQGPVPTGLHSVFAIHAIPLGTLVILLSPGPFRLLYTPNVKWKAVGGLLLALGVVLMVLTEKRGTFWAIVVMTLPWIYYRAGRAGFLVAVLLVAVTLVAPKGLNFYRSLPQSNPTYSSILHRVELYPFSLHVFLKHPVTGIGLRSFTHDRYLADYQQYNPHLEAFPETVKKLQTFDNMFLTAFVELGTPMTLAYLGLIFFIIRNYCRRLRPLARAPGLDFYRLLVVVGFLVHSLTYDSMVFPSVNWLFHVQLGILAGYGADKPQDSWR